MTPDSPNEKRPLFVNGRDLLHTQFPEPQWVVNGLIPSGMTLLAGPPKKGKSWFALELALAVCAGGNFLSRPAHPGKVWYCALEDSPRRIQERMAKQNWDDKAADNLSVTYGHEFRTFRESGAFIAILREMDFGLVIIDTLSRAFPVKDWNDVSAVTRAISPIQEAMAALGKSILFIDHHRKRGLLGSDDDPIADIIGSTAKAGIADTILGLYREAGKPGAKLSITGRDIDEQTLDLRFDLSTGCWQESSPEERLSDKQREILDELRAAGSVTIAQMAKDTGMNRGQLYQILASLEAKNLAQRNGKEWSAV